MGSGDANKKRALFHQFYTQVMDRRIFNLEEQIKALEDDYIDDYANYLNNTFNPRIKKLQDKNNLDYFDIKVIKSWLRKNEEEIIVTKFLEEVESLRTQVDLDQAKIDTLDQMITMTQLTYDNAIETALMLEERQFRRYQAECQKVEGTYRPFTKQEIKAYTTDNSNWACVSESYIDDNGDRKYRNAFAQIMIGEQVVIDMHKATLKVVLNEKVEAE